MRAGVGGGAWGVTVRARAERVILAGFEVRVMHERLLGRMRFSKCVWMFLEVCIGSRCACSILKGRRCAPGQVGREFWESTESQQVCARWKEDEDLICAGAPKCGASECSSRGS